MLRFSWTVIYQEMCCCFFLSHSSQKSVENRSILPISSFPFVISVITAFRTEVFRSLQKSFMHHLYSFPLSQLRVQQLVLQIEPYHGLFVIQHWNGLDYYVACQCNSPGLVTMMCGNHNNDFFVHFVTGCCAVILPFLWFVFSLLWEHSFSLISLYQHDLSRIQFSVSWLEMVYWRNDSSMQSGLVSLGVITVLQQLLFYGNSSDQEGVKPCILACIYKKGPQVPSGSITLLVSFNFMFGCLGREVLL